MAMYYRERAEPFARRVKAEGRWRHYVALRTKLLAEGLSPSKAYNQAIQHFLPFNWQGEVRVSQILASDPIPGEPPKKPVDKRAEAEAAAAAEDAPVYARLSEAAGAREAGYKAEVVWVNNHLDTPLEEIEPESIPSKGALALLRWARESKGNREKFYTTHYAKLAPSKSDLQAEGRQGDDGRKSLAVIEQVMAARKRAMEVAGGGV